MDAEDLESDPYVCIARTIPGEPSSQLPLAFVFNLLAIDHLGEHQVLWPLWLLLFNLVFEVLAVTQEEIKGI